MRTKSLGRLGAIIATCVGTALAVGAPVASAEPTKVNCLLDLLASGSSLQNLAQKEVWSPKFHGLTTLWVTENTLCNQMTEVLYTATSSGKGLNEWGAKSGKLEKKEAGNGKEELDAFVGTDVGPDTTQMEKMNEAGQKSATEKNGVVAVPVAQSAIAVVVTLPVGCTASGAVVVKNKGLAGEWNEDKVSFASLLETVSGTCTAFPLLEAREKPSGTTAGFKRYLAKLNSTTYGTFVNTAEKAESEKEWPNLANKDETGNDTGLKLAETVYKTAATLGYADLADARKAGFTLTPTEHLVGTEKFYSFFVEVNNEGLKELGHNESPEVGSSGASNCSGAVYPEPTEVAPGLDWSKAEESNGLEGKEGVYPICTLTYDVAWQHYGYLGANYTNDEETANTVLSYLNWVVNKNGGGQSGTVATELEKNHYGLLPTGVQKRAESGVTKAHVGL